MNTGNFSSKKSMNASTSAAMRMEKSLNSDPRAAHISGWLSDDEYLALNRENRTLNPYLGDFAHSGSTDLQLFVDTKGDRRFSKRAAPFFLS
jgi:hypothetical protein